MPNIWGKIWVFIKTTTLISADFLVKYGVQSDSSSILASTAKQWTEAQAIDYALRNSPRPIASVKSEIRRYFNAPGQATAYKIGMLKILELRSRAMTALGDKFDYRDFHDVILGNGPLPLPLLESQVDTWIAKQKGL